MIDNTERLKNLQAWKIKKDIEENAKKQIEEEKQAKTVRDIEALWDRAKAIIDLYNAAIDVGLPLPKEEQYTETRAFESNSWSHKLGVGFYGDAPTASHGRRSANAISIRGGGMCDYEIDLYNGHLRVKGGSPWRQLYSFVDQFDLFEKYFYETWDKLTA